MLAPLPLHPVIGKWHDMITEYSIAQTRCSKGCTNAVIKQWLMLLTYIAIEGDLVSMSANRYVTCVMPRPATAEPVIPC